MNDNVLDDVPESLVEYEKPQLLQENEDGKFVQTSLFFKENNSSFESFFNKEQETKSEMREILNAILPPRTWKSSNGYWQQEVSSTTSSRKNVMELQEKLEKLLQDKQARSCELCPIREELISQIFDELIRQVTLVSPERGLLLLRIRDHTRMTIEVYQSIYHSSVSFGIKKATEAEEGMEDLENQIAQLEQHVGLEKTKLLELQYQMKVMENSYQQENERKQKKHQDICNVLKSQIQQLESFYSNSNNKE